MMDPRIPLALGAFMIYILVFFIAAAVSLWLASNWLSFKHKTLRKAVRILVIYLALVSVPHAGIILLFIFYSSSITFDALSQYLLISIIALSQLLLLFLIKHSYMEPWEKVVSAYLLYILVLVGAYILLSMLQAVLGVTFLDFSPYLSLPGL